MLKATFLTQYRKAGGKLVFIYLLDGTVEQLAEYKKVKGEHYREHDVTKKPMFFSPRLGGKAAEIKLNADGKDYSMDTTRLDQLANFTAQYGAEIAETMMADFEKKAA